MTNSPTSECCPHIHSKYTSTFEIVFCLHINDDTIWSVFAINLVNITLLATFKETCCILTFSLEFLLQMFSRKIVCNFLVLLECKNPLITLLWINEEVDIWFLGIVIIVFFSVANSKCLIQMPKIHLQKIAIFFENVILLATLFLSNSNKILSWIQKKYNVSQKVASTFKFRQIRV